MTWQLAALVRWLVVSPVVPSGRYPAIKNSPRSGQNHNVVSLAGEVFNHLDSGLTEGQPVLSLSKGRNDVVFSIGLFGLIILIKCFCKVTQLAEFSEVNPRLCRGTQQG
jgi:hypothetical protein